MAGPKGYDPKVINTENPKSELIAKSPKKGSLLAESLILFKFDPFWEFPL
jgi:hypothetical protein